MNETEFRLARVLEFGVAPGKDVYAHKRAVYRLLKGGLLTKLETKPETVKETFQEEFTGQVKRAQVKLRVPQDGVIGPLTHALLEPSFDSLAKSLLAGARPTMVSPIPRGVAVTVGGLHETSGVAGNWALDWICASGTPILCSEAGVVTKLSGHDPSDDTWDSQGVYGWSIHFETKAGYHYFVTHLGWRSPLKVGDRLEVGDILGRVGDQHFRPDHVHEGVSSPHGESDAKVRILAVRDSPRVDP